MSVIGANNWNNYPMWSAMQNFPNMQQATPQSSVAITTPQGRNIYQYPQTSVYNDPAKQATSGLNIFVFNPSGIGAPSTINNTANYGNNPMTQPIASSPIANTPLKTEEDTKSNKKQKKIVSLTNDYIKTLESFLRSQDSSVRKQGVLDLIKRFEEDNSRYDNASLTALLNIALQDPDENNRLLAISVVASGGAHGDLNTIQLLNNLTSSDKLFGQEAKLASSALLKTSQTREFIDDDSSIDNNKSDKQNETPDE